MKKYKIIVLLTALSLVLGFFYFNNKTTEKIVSTSTPEKEIIIDPSQHLDWENFQRLASHINTEVIDIRTPQEIQTGKLFNNALEIDFENKNFIDKIKKLDKTKIYLIYCRSGNRSLEALKTMRKNGITAYDLENGITNPDIKK